ncbi:MAG: tRNA uridine-5-carboxymethylaminomethyl(34) synthesis GTPase MnmE [Acidobacteria bacterium]|nr:tRNA uridine-5-carboxymethylaminomethyl(34) synthesis GTPase MnmE [Acidobacteriota bacterium]
MLQTIVALATPLGRSGIGVVRLSGGESLSYTTRLCGEKDLNLEPRHASLKSIVDLEKGEVIDEAIMTYFKAPHSFTGEDIVEISCHGSPVLLRLVIDSCLKLGARMAEPGEFSLRALANGQMNLAEAEAIRDLIDAQTAASARQAVRQMRGEFSNTLHPVKDGLLDAIVVLESALEFVEDDLPEVQAAGIRQKLAAIADDIGRIAATFKAGRLIRDGLRVTLVGRPNVGKSSLFNAFLGSDRAIVTEIPGTTRDQIHERFVVNDIPVSLMDTAGLRDTEDLVESIGVERSRMAMADSDLVVVLIDGSEELTAEDLEILNSVEALPHIIAVNKIDKIEHGKLSAIIGSVNEGRSAEIVAVSAKLGTGIESLKNGIVTRFSPDTAAGSGFLVTDARHHDLLVRAKAEIESSIALLDQKTSEEIVLIGLHNALRYLGQITGETTTEDMLTKIFSTFCIGK